jgi:ABC-type transport system involved in multi-copper enzyme maturation permease subunit
MNSVMILLKRDLKNSINRRVILLLGFMVLLQTWFIFSSGSIESVKQSGQMHFMAIVFSFNLFGPIVALALSYDSISTDRENKVMDLILTSGISKKKVGFSKILNNLIISVVFAVLYVLIILLIFLFASKDLSIRCFSIFKAR